MALPPRGDPRRPLHLAIRSTRLIGIIIVGLGSLMFVPMLLFAPRAIARGRILALSSAALRALVFLGQGVGYLIIAYFLKRRRHWAIVAGLVMASIQLLLVLCVGVVAVYFAIMSFNTPMRDGRQNDDRMITLCMVGAVVGLIILALAQLIYHLTRSFEAIKIVPIEEQRGFEPLMAQPVEELQI